MRKTLFTIIALIASANMFAQDATDGRDLIFDNENLYTDEQEAEIGQILNEYQKTWGDREIVVVTTDKCAPFQTFAEYAQDLCNNWQPARAEDSNALLLIISKKLGSVRIATGEGTTSLIENQKCHGIINFNMMPYLKKGQFFEATKVGVTVLSKNWK